MLHTLERKKMKVRQAMKLEPSCCFWVAPRAQGLCPAPWAPMKYAWHYWLRLQGCCGVCVGSQAGLPTAGRCPWGRAACWLSAGLAARKNFPVFPQDALWGWEPATCTEAYTASRQRGNGSTTSWLGDLGPVIAFSKPHIPYLQMGMQMKSVSWVVGRINGGNAGKQLAQCLIGEVKQNGREGGREGGKREGKEAGDRMWI